MLPAQVTGITGTEFSESATHSAEIPGGNPGDLLIAFAGLANGSTITLTPPTGWTAIAATLTSVIGSHRLSLARYAKIATGDESTVEFTTSQSDVAGSAQVYRFNRWKGAIATHLSAAGGDGSTGTSPNAASFSVTWGERRALWFNYFVHAADGALATVSAAPTGYENYVHTRPTSGTVRAGLVVAYRESFATSENPGAFTLSEANDALSSMVAVRPEWSEGAGRRRLMEMDGQVYEIRNALDVELLREQLSKAEVESEPEEMPAYRPPRTYERTVIPTPHQRTSIALPTANTGMRRLARKHQ